MTAATQRHIPRFLERNTFLAAWLGLSSMSRRAREWVEAQAQGELPAPSSPKDSVFFDFLLGVLSASRGVERLLGSFSGEHPEPTPDPSISEPPCLRSLLG
jgi:hypothetical protein